MDRTDLAMALNEQDEYQPHQQKVTELAAMLLNTDQAQLIRESLAQGETVEKIADELGQIWDVDADTLAEAIRKALEL